MNKKALNHLLLENKIIQGFYIKDKNQPLPRIGNTRISDWVDRSGLGINVQAVWHCRENAVCSWTQCLTRPTGQRQQAHTSCCESGVLLYEMAQGTHPMTLTLATGPTFFQIKKIRSIWKFIFAYNIMSLQKCDDGDIKDSNDRLCSSAVRSPHPKI